MTTDGPNIDLAMQRVLHCIERNCTGWKVKLVSTVINAEKDSSTILGLANRNWSVKLIESSSEPDHDEVHLTYLIEYSENHPLYVAPDPDKYCAAILDHLDGIHRRLDEIRDMLRQRDT